MVKYEEDQDKRAYENMSPDMSKLKIILNPISSKGVKINFRSARNSAEKIRQRDILPEIHNANKKIKALQSISQSHSPINISTKELLLKVTDSKSKQKPLKQHQKIRDYMSRIKKLEHAKLRVQN